jgi:sugar phosphate isomerase/epimerase
MRQHPRLVLRRAGGDVRLVEDVLLIGEGEVELRRVVTDLRDGRYDGWFSVESHALPRGARDSAAIAATEIASVRGLLEARRRLAPSR